MPTSEPLAPKPPPAQDSCAICYFSTIDALGIMRCCYWPPLWQRSTVPGSGPPGAPPPASPLQAQFSTTIKNWPIVDANDWCGHGYNTINSLWMTPDGTKPNA